MSGYIIEVRRVHSRKYHYIEPLDMSLKELNKHLLKIRDNKYNFKAFTWNPDLELQHIVVETFKGNEVLLGWADVDGTDDFDAKVFMKRIRSGESVTLWLDNL